jgi:hypothetical protein
MTSAKALIENGLKLVQRIGPGKRHSVRDRIGEWLAKRKYYFSNTAIENNQPITFGIACHSLRIVSGYPLPSR